MTVKHLTMEELEAGLEEIRRSPRDAGLLELIVRRPCVDEREVLEAGELNLTDGLVGDSWKMRGSSRTPDGSPHHDMQLNIMNSHSATSRDAPKRLKSSIVIAICGASRVKDETVLLIINPSAPKQSVLENCLLSMPSPMRHRRIATKYLLHTRRAFTHQILAMCRSMNEAN